MQNLWLDAIHVHDSACLFTIDSKMFQRLRMLTSRCPDGSEVSMVCIIPEIPSQSAGKLSSCPAFAQVINGPAQAHAVSQDHSQIVQVSLVKHFVVTTCISFTPGVKLLHCLRKAVQEF